MTLVPPGVVPAARGGVSALTSRIGLTALTRSHSVDPCFERGAMVPSEHAATARRYDETWAETDAARRLNTLREIWAEDGLYTDPDVPEGIRGPRALSDFIAASLDELPGLTITATTDVAMLGDRAWYRWSATTGDGQSFEGTDFIEFGVDGRIQRLTNFYDN